MRYHEISEATTNYVHKAIDPALMTFKEYHDLVNPQNKRHSAMAYDEDVQSFGNIKPDDYPILVSNFTKNGIPFELRMEKDDKWSYQYTKTDKDGNVVYGPDGAAEMMSKEEVAAMIPEERRIVPYFAVIDKDRNIVVGNTQDEWGTMLLRVAREYRGFGLGQILMTVQRKATPAYNSGGFTQAGLRTLIKLHDSLVREYLASGMYSHLVKEGVISLDKVKQIIGGLSKRAPKKKEKNYNTNKMEDWLFLKMDNARIVYDKKIYNMDLDNPDEKYWTDMLIKATIQITSYDVGEVPFVERLTGDDKLKRLLLIDMLQEGPLRLDYEEMDVLYSIPDIKNKIEVDTNTELPTVTLHVDIIDLDPLYTAEKQYRKKHDQYDEMYHRITEMALLG